MLSNQLFFFRLQIFDLLQDFECFCSSCDWKPTILSKDVNEILLEMHSMPILQSSILIICPCRREMHCQTTIRLLEEEGSLSMHHRSGCIDEWFHIVIVDREDIET